MGRIATRHAEREWPATGRRRGSGVSVGAGARTGHTAPCCGNFRLDLSTHHAFDGRLELTVLGCRVDERGGGSRMHGQCDAPDLRLPSQA